MVRISIVGAGVVGLANAIMLAYRHEVVLLDIDPSRVRALNDGKCPVQDPDISAALTRGGLRIRATVDAVDAYSIADYVVIATPTDYVSTMDGFNTESVETAVCEALQINPGAPVVIKSTVPVGFTDRMRAQHPGAVIFFSPEFLREGHGLRDTLHPSRIIIGDNSDAARRFGRLLVECAAADSTSVLIMTSSEAEAVKLFSNTFLALRIAYFNELDTFALVRGLDPVRVIEGVGLDPRIGAYYNNPSFGYGGYCLPKDSKQLLANYADIPQDLVAAVVVANATRKNFIASQVLMRGPRVVGIYQLGMKAGSDNFRSSAVQDIIRLIQAAGVEVIIYEPALADDLFMGSAVVRSLIQFKNRADVILCNRRSAQLADVVDKVFTRDIYGCD